MNRFLLPAFLFTLNAACLAGPIINIELDGRDLQFLTAVAENGVMLGSLGEVAQARAGSEPVKKLGEAMVLSHAAEKMQVQRVAVAKRIDVANAADAAQIARVDKLTKLQAPKFEKACMDEILQTYGKMLDAIKMGTKSADVDIRALAEKLLPQVNQQLVLAQKIVAVQTSAGTSPVFRATLPGR